MDQDKLVARINERKAKDMFGFEWHEYLPYLEHARLKPFFKPDPKLDDLPATELVDREKILAKMKGYLSFAFEKAHGERGISASRSLMHYIAWAWLAGDEAFSEEIDRMTETDYAPYGLPVLRRICAFYEWDPSEHGDGEFHPSE